MRWMLLLFVLVPLVELYLLLYIGSLIGFWPTLAVVVATAMIGVTLAKREGYRVWQSYRAALAEGRVPDEGILGGLLVFLGGLLLVTPGVLTDLCGLLLLVPRTRALVASRLQQVIQKKIDTGMMRVVTIASPFQGAGVRSECSSDGFFPGVRPGDPNVVDTEGVEVQTHQLLGPGKPDT